MKFIIIGAGEVGISLAERLQDGDHDVSIIEKVETKLVNFPAHLDVQTVVGDGCNPSILKNAGIDSADYIVSVTDNDAVNIATCQIAKFLNPKAKRISRLRTIDLKNSDIADSDIRNLFDLVINPDQAGASHIAKLYKARGAKNLIYCADKRLAIIGLTIKEDSAVAGKKLSTIREENTKTPLILLSLIRDGKVIIPRGTDKVKEGDLAYVISYPQNKKDIFTLAGHTLEKSKTAIVWGGTSIGDSIAKEIAKTGSNVKLILPEELATHEKLDELNNILVLVGAGTDKNLLIEENIGEIDAFVAATTYEEDNILASLLAKNLGAKQTFALVHKRSYLPIIKDIGVDITFSAQEAAASEIFQFIHSDTVNAEFSLKDCDANCYEVPVEKNEKLVDKKIKDLNLPSGIIIAGIINDTEIKLPTGDDILNTDDRILIFVSKKSAIKLKTTLNIDLEFLEH